MWSKILISFLIVFFTTSQVFAHPGRIDSNGGHRVNKKFTYDGKYLVIKNGVRLAREGKITFSPNSIWPGNYHYHVHPNFVPNVKNGIFLPVNDKDVRKVRTDIIYKSEENVIVSKESDIYHKLSCHFVDRMKLENIIIFEDKEDAEKNDYIPCKVCKSEVRK